MKTISAILISLTFIASRALAAGGASEGGSYGLLTECLIALLVMIFLFQFVPGFSLLLGMVKGMFAADKVDKPVGSECE